MVLNLGWVPWDQNEEADALTNGDFAAFDASRRINVEVTKISWRILPRMLEVAEQIYDKVQRSKVDGGPPKAATPHKKRNFRQVNPW